MPHRFSQRTSIFFTASMKTWLHISLRMASVKVARYVDSVATVMATVSVHLQATISGRHMLVSEPPHVFLRKARYSGLSALAISAAMNEAEGAIMATTRNRIS